ncbi:MAG: isoprenylcysteine carboxylmethyltransferase family protein, partial [Chloroflexi bacterium]|nr:isoprenylcysteine carboxylmethyltransferase family protein [Chloroflexota bacterium]
GIALALDSVWALALLPFVLIAVQRGIIAREEKYLEQKFGDEYRAYQARVRRWI